MYLILTYIWCISFYRAESEGNLKGILGYTEDAVVSTDFIGDSRYVANLSGILLVCFLTFAMH